MSSIFSGVSILQVSWNNLLQKPVYTNVNASSGLITETVIDLSSYLTCNIASNIFITSNTLSNTSNNLFNFTNNINSNSSNNLLKYTNEATSNSSNNLFNYINSQTSNSSNNVYSNIIDLNYTTASNVSNIIIKDYNNLISKPWINLNNNIYNNIGNIGIGITNPSYQLDCYGSMKLGIRGTPFASITTFTLFAGSSSQSKVTYIITYASINRSYPNIDNLIIFLTPEESTGSSEIFYASIANKTTTSLIINAGTVSGNPWNPPLNLRINICIYELV